MGMLPIGLALSATGVVLLRISWSRQSQALAGLGWASLATATPVLAGADGAWAVTLGALVATGVAALLLTHSAIVAPAGRAPATRQGIAGEGWRFSASDLGRRIAVFALVGPGAFAAAQLLAFGAQAAARRAEWHEADATVLGLLLQPIAWAILAAVQITRTGPLRMIVPALITAAAGLLLWRVP
jgi:hypothetical protein